MKSLLQLWRVLALELGEQCHTSTLRDIKTVSQRFEHEGLSFLTITLPTFAKDLETCLEAGHLVHDCFLSFRKGSSGFPRLFGGFLAHVFDEHGAVLPINDRQIESISAIRQLSAFCGKVELPCSNARNVKTLEDFVTADEATGEWDDTHDWEFLADFRRIASLLYGDVLSSLSQKLADGNIVPKHGPGSTADRLRGNAKYDLSYWPERLEHVFPYTEFGRASLNRGLPPEGVTFASEDDELPSRVILVPKTLKAPRIIAAEPTALQYMQQAVAKPLASLLEEDRLIGGMVGFTDQTLNQDMARTGSSSGKLATLDMSEASDRVSVSQALALVEYHPWVREAFEATRSTCARLPNGRVMPIRKFAAMGSALCFPVEAMCFLTCVFMGIERQLISQGSGKHLSKADIRRYRGSVRVYGDDIIIPVDSVPFVTETFSLMGWKVNAAKSFWTGQFRESCGGDYYAGEDVTPVRVRSAFPESRQDSSEVVSLVALRNHMYDRGYWKTARWLDIRVEKFLPHYPRILPSSPLLGRHSLLGYESQKLHKAYQSPLARGFFVSPRIPTSLASDEGSLLKCLIAPGMDDKHLEKSGRPLVVDIKLGWRQPF